MTRTLSFILFHSLGLSCLPASEPVRRTRSRGHAQLSLIRREAASVAEQLLAQPNNRATFDIG
jgi:hypothetical protein